MHKINRDKAQMHKDIVLNYGSLTLRCWVYFLGKELGGIFNLYAEYIMQNSGLDEAEAEIKIAGRNIKNLRYADDTTLMAES